jgi:hypothetical protein
MKKNVVHAMPEQVTRRPDLYRSLSRVVAGLFAITVPFAFG